MPGNTAVKNRMHSWAQPQHCTLPTEPFFEIRSTDPVILILLLIVARVAYPG